MSEQYIPPKIAVEKYQDVLDALTLAFFNEPLKDCTVKDLQFSPMGGDEWINCKRRTKRSYDPSRGCDVIVTHYTYTCVHEHGVEDKDAIAVEWVDDEETNIMLDLHNSSMGTYLYMNRQSVEYISFEKEQADVHKIQMKMGLAAVTSL